MIKQVDLAVKMGRLCFENPYILASAPPTADGNFIRRAFALGWAGAVIKTVKPDDLVIEDVSPRFSVLKDRQGSIIGFENFELVSKKSVAYWVEEIKQIKAEFPTKMLIASIMADRSSEAWQRLALELELAGADALELNFSCPHGMPEKGIGSAIGQDAAIAAEITGWVKAVATIPVIVKLSPNVTDIGLVALAVERAGADAIAAINTVQCLVGVDLDKLEPLPSVAGVSTYGGYSGRAVKPIGLRCVAQIFQSVSIPVCGMGGIATWQDAVEYMALGAGAVQVCTEVMLNGLAIITPLLAGLSAYLAKKGLTGLSGVHGVAAAKLVAHERLSRRRVVRAGIIDEAACILCKKCITACSDSGYEAIATVQGRITIDENKCDGCSLCSLVCPKQIIGMNAYEKWIS